MGMCAKACGLTEDITGKIIFFNNDDVLTEESTCLAAA
jgi:hypothetical protein